MKAKQSEPSKHSGFSTSDNSTANTPQDYSGNMKSFPSRSPSQGDEDSALILTQDNLKSSDPDLSANSDQESGVEDLSCRSPSGGECAPSEDSGKDRDSDEAVFLTAWSFSVEFQNKGHTRDTFQKEGSSAIQNKKIIQEMVHVFENYKT